MSIFSKNTNEKNTNETAPTAPPAKHHPIMGILRSFGLDPAEILNQVEWARKTADDTVQHFNARFDRIESRINEQNVVLGQILGLLQDQTKHDTTESELLKPLKISGHTFGCETCGLGFGDAAELQDHSETCGFGDAV
jgi:hypothetical protein